ncbi:MAG: PQQ-dependent sugar dehydrogenase [Verrucomicrobiota bacterium]
MKATRTEAEGTMGTAVPGGPGWVADRVRRRGPSFVVLILLLLAGEVSIRQLAASGWRRESNATLRLPEVPGGFGYQLTDALGLTFASPVAVATPPGETNRLFVVEQAGQVVVITNLAAPTRSIFLNVTANTVSGGEQGLLGLAFHPEYARNGRFFVFRTLTTTTAGNANRRHNRLSEFRVSPGDPHRAQTTETVLFQQADEASNHNGGDLHFGPDGFLYVALGDEGGGNDQYGNSQRIDRDFFAGILRLDVDNRPGSLPPNPHPAVVGGYRVPADNPLVGATEFLGRSVNPAAVRTEFWAVGLRNPWRMSFDRATGELWVGDVGQGARESIFVSGRGANHGWAFREGNVAGPKTGMPADFLTHPRHRHVGPLYAYPHGSGNFAGDSVTGGVVYRGDRLSQLHGSYVFADYVRGHVWALRRVPGAAPQVTRLLSRGNLSAFGLDPRNGDVLAVEHTAGRISRLTYNSTFTGMPLPPTLAETGAFADLARLLPAPGVVAYGVNAPFWSDHAEKQRWFSIPDTNRFLGFAPQGTWSIPPGSVWIKHFDLPVTNGAAVSMRRLETRFLVRNSAGIHGATYRWNSPTNAVLVPEEGADEEILHQVGGEVVRQVWHYPGRAECLACHNPQAGFMLSFETAQLNRPGNRGDDSGHQIAQLVAAGYVTNAPASLAGLPVVTPPGDESWSVEHRARSYLAVNCAPCHRPGGVGGGLFDARLETPTALAGLLDGWLNDPAGDPANRVLVPGAPERSVALLRAGRRGPGQMPPLSSSVADAEGLSLLTRWVSEAAASGTLPRPAGLAIHQEPGHTRLEVWQPANHAVRMERAPHPSGGWQPFQPAGPGPTYPAQDQRWSVPIDPAEASMFYRVWTSRP